MKKWTNTLISSDLSHYKYGINKSTKEIYINQNSYSVNPKLDYKLYDSFKRKGNQEYIVDVKDFFYAFVSFWDNNNDDFTLVYKVINPGNEHLSTDMIPNKKTYLIWVIIWILIFIASSSLIIVKIYQTKSFNIHSILILINYFIVTIFWIGKYFYWINLSKHGKISDAADPLLLIFESIILTLYLLIINLYASGYKIVNQYFRFLSFAKNLIAIGFYVIFALILNYQFLFVVIFMLILIVIMILMLRMDISTSIQSLQRVLVNESNILQYDPDYVSEIKKKIKFYKCFRVYIYIYFFFESWLLSTQPFLQLYHDWIFTMMHQIIILVGMSFLFVILSYSFKYRQQELILDINGIPLPFDKNKDAKIWGEIIIIHNKCDDIPPSNKKNKIITAFPSVSVGVEWSYHNTRKPVLQSNPVEHAKRAAIYQVNEFNEEEARCDVLKILNLNNQINEVDNTPECFHYFNRTTPNFVKNIDEEERVYKPNKNLSFDLENELVKSDNSNGKDLNFQMFYANKFIDFSWYV